MKRIRLIFPALLLFSSLFAQQPASVVEVDSYASCFVYEVQDASGNKVELTEDMENLLACSPSTPLLSPDAKKLILFGDNAVLAYDFAAEQTDTLYRIPDKTEGISDFLFSPNGRALAFVVVSQEAFPSMTKLVIMRMEDGEKMNHRELDLKINFSCGSMCVSYPQSDFWFADDNTIGYVTWNSVPYDLDALDGERMVRIW